MIRTEDDIGSLEKECDAAASHSFKIAKALKKKT